MAFFACIGVLVSFLLILAIASRFKHRGGVRRLPLD